MEQWHQPRAEELRPGLRRPSYLATGPAQLHRRDLKLAEGETVGQVGLYQLLDGKRDAELPRLPDH